MTAEPHLLEVERLTFRYRRASEPALRDISLSVAPGQVVLVAGPSGCGKSTLVRAINGLIPHAYPGELGGEVRVDGRPTAGLRLRDIARTVGTVLQDPAKQIVGATVEAELAFGPENLGMPRGEILDRMAAVAEEAGIRSLLGRETAHLSGGERQLLAIAGILMLRPRLYVVDEPLANLDPAAAAGLLGILRGLADRGHGIVIVEHRVEEALDLRPDSVLYLEEGLERYQGPLDGFLRVADPSAVKLPFEVILDRFRSDPVRSAIEPGAAGNLIAVPPLDAAGDGSIDRTARLEFREVRAGFDDREVLHGVSAALGAGETVAVLGPNGSGKTTLFRAAMRLLPLFAGDVLVDGVSTAERTVAGLATIFGYVFQSPSQMLFARTVREELVFGPRNLGRPPEAFDPIVADVLRRVALDRLDGIEARPPLSLSFGQQKRLALAIALSLQPRTLILDEPSAGQDHRTALTFMAEVGAIDGLDNLYFVTHDVDLALTHADRILLFREGMVVADGPPTEVIEDEQRWQACHLRPTSLMRASARWLTGDGRLLDAELLARRIVALERTGRSRDPEREGRPPAAGAQIDHDQGVEGS